MRLFYSAFQFNSSELTAKSRIAFFISIFVFTIVIVQQIKLVFLPDLFEMAPHLYNCLFHASCFLVAGLLAKRNLYKESRCLLIFGFISYLSFACLAWRINFNLQYLFLLAVFVITHLYSNSEKSQRRWVTTGLLGLFIYFQTTLSYPVIVQSWQTSIYIANAAVLVVGVLACNLIVLKQVEREWRGLKRKSTNYADTLKQILPAKLVGQLCQSNMSPDPQPSLMLSHHTFVTVIFIDFSGYTDWCAKLGMRRVMQQMHAIFSHFDALADRHDLYKIKTNGDQYMLVSGLSSQISSSGETCLNAVKFANDVRKWSITRPENEDISLRIGIASGQVASGIIGKSRPAYDVWGDPVNLASRLEAHASENSVLICENTAKHLGDAYSISEKKHHEFKGLGCIGYFQVV